MSFCYIRPIVTVVSLRDALGIRQVVLIMLACDARETELSIAGVNHRGSVLCRAYQRFPGPRLECLLAFRSRATCSRKSALRETVSRDAG